MQAQETVSLYRIKQAYALNGQEAQMLLNNLMANDIFPFAVWYDAYSLFWKEAAAVCAHDSGIDDIPFPEYQYNNKNIFPTEEVSNLFLDFFFEMSRRVPALKFESGFDYVLEICFESKEYINKCDRDSIFYNFYSIEKNIINYRRIKKIKETSRNLSYPEKIKEIYFDSIQINCISAINYLSNIKNFPFSKEVKGITARLVEYVIKSYHKELLIPQNDISHSNNDKVFVQKSIWNGKSSTFIVEKMRESGYGDDIIAYILFFKRDIKKKREIGKLLGPKNVSDFAYDKIGKELLERASTLKIMDID